MVSSSYRSKTPQRPVVMIVDDEEGDRAVMEAILSDDYEVVCCSSGEEAIKALDRYPEAVVLCDQRMPGLTGDEVVTRIRVLYPDTVRILVTAYTDAASIIRALNEGGIFAYIEKPFDPETLRRMVAKAVKYQEIALENQRLLREIRRLRLQVEAVVQSGRIEPLGDLNSDGLAVRDALTTLYGPDMFLAKLQEEQDRVLRYGNAVSILVADIDDFASINADYGREVGDRVLRQVAAVMSRWSRSVDFVARVADPVEGPSSPEPKMDDRFVVLAPNTLEAGARILAERLRRAIEALRMELAPSHLRGVTVSFGVACCEGASGPLLREVLRRASEALQRAKKLGKNRTVTWTDLKETLATKPQSKFVSRPSDDSLTNKGGKE